MRYFSKIFRSFPFKNIIKTSKSFSSAKNDSETMNEKANKEITQLRLEFEILNISPKAEIKEIYQAYKRYAIFYNPQIYFEQDVCNKNLFYKRKPFLKRDYKYRPIKNAYLKIMQHKQKNISLLNDSEAKGLS
jgi:hypothetical protein